MSKRKNRSGAPNLPRETLERARRQANAPAAPAPEDEVADGSAEVVEAEAAPAPVPAPPPRAAAPRRTAEPRATGTTSSARSASTAARRGRGVRPVSSTGRREKDNSRIAAILEHPTKFVSDEELRNEYGYVMEELRQIAVAAVGLIVVMVVLAFVLPR